MSLPKLLVVDDSSTVRTKLKGVLTRAGYDVIVAANGLEALDRLVEDPDLIVLDVNMPELDGYGVCERMRDLGSKYERLPIVFLTSLETKALELLGREFGAYLHKPVSDEKLVSVVQEQLALSD